MFFILGSIGLILSFFNLNLWFFRQQMITFTIFCYISWLTFIAVVLITKKPTYNFSKKELTQVIGLFFVGGMISSIISIIDFYKFYTFLLLGILFFLFGGFFIWISLQNKRIPKNPEE